ncbi:MAG: CorA family divalent cation transporter [Luteolibacter sp.]
MSALPEATFLPPQFDCEPVLMDQISNRPGHQRCMVGDGELLLVAHEVPVVGRADREALFFWKRRDGKWIGPDGKPGLLVLEQLLDRYSEAIDAHAAVVDEADTASEIFGILRHAGPLVRASRNLVQSLSQILDVDQDDRQIRALRDRSVDIERAAELLHADTRLTLEFWQAERSEQQSLAADKLNRIVFRLNLLAGFFLPLVALGGLFGMNVDLPAFVKHRSVFWIIVIFGLVTGGIILYYARLKAEREAASHPDED